MCVFRIRESYLGAGGQSSRLFHELREFELQKKISDSKFPVDAGFVCHKTPVKSLLLE